MMFVPTQYYNPNNQFNNVTQLNRMTQMNTENQYHSPSSKPDDELLKHLVESQHKPDWNEITKKMKNQTPR